MSTFSFDPFPAKSSSTDRDLRYSSLHHVPMLVVLLLVISCVQVALLLLKCMLCFHSVHVRMPAKTFFSIPNKVSMSEQYVCQIMSFKRHEYVLELVMLHDLIKFDAKTSKPHMGPQSP